MRYTTLILMTMGWLVFAQAAAAETLPASAEVATSLNECKPSPPVDEADAVNRPADVPTPLLRQHPAKPAARHQRGKAWRSFVPGVLR